MIALLRDEMERLSDAMLFEEAAGLRDRILALEKYARKQKVVSEDEADRDLFAIEVDERENVACGVVFQVREGKVIGRRHTYIHPIEGLPGSVLMQRLVEDYYANAIFFSRRSITERENRRTGTGKRTVGPATRQERTSCRTAPGPQGQPDAHGEHECGHAP